MDIEDGGKGLEYNPMDAQVARALPSRHDFLPRSTIWPLPLPLPFSDRIWALSGCCLLAPVSPITAFSHSLTPPPACPRLAPPPLLL